MSNEAVVVVDDRKVLEEKNTIPFIGLIRGKFKSDPSCFIGTGAIISEDLVLTAAHNICKISEKKFKKYKEYLQSSFISSTNGLKSTENVTGTLKSAQMSLEQTISEFKHAEYAEWLEFYPAINGKMKGFSNKAEMSKRNS